MAVGTVIVGTSQAMANAANKKQGIEVIILTLSQSGSRRHAVDKEVGSLSARQCGLSLFERKKVALQPVYSRFFMIGEFR